MPATIVSKLKTVICCLGLIAFLSPAPAKAQDAAGELSGSFMLYGWLPWIDLTSTVNSGGKFTTEVDSGSVLESLNMAFFGSGDLHYGRFGVLFDVVYADLGAKGTTRGPLSSRVGVGVNMLLMTGAVSYQAYAEGGTVIEPYVGFRYGDIETDVTVVGGGPLGISLRADAGIDWVDPIVGVRGEMPLTDSLSVDGYFDIGGFGVGTELTWQVYAGIEYSFTDNISSTLGFRYMSIDYEGSKSELKMKNYGPQAGLKLRF